MKLATIKDSTRDGRLVVVSDDLTRCVSASSVAVTMQDAMDRWDDVAGDLRALASGLESGAVPTERFREREAHAPLPRAYQWADGSAYVNHMALLRQSRGAEMPAHFWTEPLMYQGGSDSFLAPREPIRMPSVDWGIDLEGEVAVITGDVPMGCDRETAEAAIRLVMIVNDVTLRALVPDEIGKGFGFFQSKPSTAFSPVAVTPDALGNAWDGAKLQLPLAVDLNGKPLGRALAGEDMTFDFADLIQHATKSRRLTAGTIIGSGTVSNRDPSGGPGKPASEGGRGYSCIAEQRMIETIQQGEAKTPFLQHGDIVRIDVLNDKGRSVFGAIEQTVEIDE